MATQRSIEAGRAFLRLLLDDDEFRRGLIESERQTRAFGRSLRTVGFNVAAIGAAITAPFAAAARSFSLAGDELDKMSQRTGVTVEALSELKFAAGQAGTSLETVERGVRFLQKTLAAAQGGSKQAAEAFRSLGLSIDLLSGLSPIQQFEAIGTALSNISDQPTKTALAMKLLGRAGVDLLPLLSDLEKLRQKARDLGLVMSEESAKSAAELNDAFGEVSSAVGGLSNALGASIATPLTRLLNLLRDAVIVTKQWAAENNGLLATLAGLGAGILGIGAGLIGTGQVIQTLASAGELLTKQLPTLVKAFSTAVAFLSPYARIIALVSAGVVALGGAWTLVTKETEGSRLAAIAYRTEQERLAANERRRLADIQKETRAIREQQEAREKERARGDAASDRRRLAGAAARNPIEAEVEELRIRTSTEELDRERALADLRRRRSILEFALTEAYSDKLKQAIEERYQLELKLIERNAVEEEDRREKERQRRRESLETEIERVRVDIGFKGFERDRRLLEVERREALAGVDKEQPEAGRFAEQQRINELFNLRRAELANRNELDNFAKAAARARDSIANLPIGGLATQLAGQVFGGGRFEQRMLELEGRTAKATEQTLQELKRRQGGILGV